MKNERVVVAAVAFCWFMDRFFPLQTGGTSQAIAPVVVAALIAAGSAYMQSRKKKQEATSSGTVNQTQTSTPTFDPRFNNLLQAGILKQQAKVNRGASLPAGFETNAAEKINAANAGARTNLEASLAARGLGTSPVAAGALAGLEQNRSAQIGNLGVELPMLERQMEQEDFGQLMALLGLGKGTSTRTVGTNTGVQVQPNQNNNAEDIGMLLGQMYASGAFNKQPKAATGTKLGSFSVE